MIAAARQANFNLLMPLLIGVLQDKVAPRHEVSAMMFIPSAADQILQSVKRCRRHEQEFICARSRIRVQWNASFAEVDRSLSRRRWQR
jgi:hypothetical membrane protein